jgi:hypothetical protein
MLGIQAERGFFFFMYKLKHVPARRQLHLDAVSCTFLLVVLFKTLSQAICGNPDNCVRLGIKGRRTVERLHRNAVFLDVLRIAGKVFLADEGQEILHIGPLTQET